MAMYLFRYELYRAKINGVNVFSRGLWVGRRGESLSEGAKAALHRRHIPTNGHLSTRLTQSDMEKADLILVMTRDHLNDVRRQFPKESKKTYLLREYVGVGRSDILDPYGDDEAYEVCYQEIEACTQRLIQTLSQRGSDEN
jgi:protein-tyrosine-phosphatase